MSIRGYGPVFAAALAVAAAITDVTAITRRLVAAASSGLPRP
jgi:hypothetical protein